MPPAQGRPHGPPYDDAQIACPSRGQRVPKSLVAYGAVALKVTGSSLAQKSPPALQSRVSWRSCLCWGQTGMPGLSLTLWGCRSRGGPTALPDCCHRGRRAGDCDFRWQAWRSLGLRVSRVEGGAEVDLAAPGSSLYPTELRHSCRSLNSPSAQRQLQGTVTLGLNTDV